MEAIEFKTEKQFIEDMEQAIVAKWLECNLAPCAPSYAADLVMREFVEAWKRDATENPDEWLYEFEFMPMFKAAKKLADKRYYAAMTLRGIEEV